MGRSKHIHCCTHTWRKSPFVPMLGESTAQDATAPHRAIIATELLFKIKINKLDQTSNRSRQKSPLATIRKINHFNCAMRHNLGDPINLWLSAGARRGKSLWKPGEVSSAPARLLLSQEPRELLRELHIAQSYTCTERQKKPNKQPHNFWSSWWKPTVSISRSLKSSDANLSNITKNTGAEGSKDTPAFKNHSINPVPHAGQVCTGNYYPSLI